MPAFSREGTAPPPSRLVLAALIAANLVVAVQALRWGWGYYELLLIYWCEALVIGGYNVLRMMVVGLFGDQPFGAWLSRWAGFSFGSRLLLSMLGTGFFALKFGGFALITGFWLLMLPVHFDAAGNRPATSVVEGLSQAGPGVVVAIGVLVASHGASFVWNFLRRREFATQTLIGLVFWPYVRMALVLAVVVGGLFVVKLNPGLEGATVMIVLFVPLKSAADAVTHRWERRSREGRHVVSRGPQTQAV
jgi:hypothetical protein